MSEKKEAAVSVKPDEVVEATLDGSNVKSFKISRELFTSKKTGKDGYTYFLEGEVRGRKVKAKVVPKDKGGYEVLDIIYDGAMACDLRIEQGEMENEKTGEKIKFESYVVYSKDPVTGDEFDLKVKPEKDSDKAKFKFILRQ